MGNLVNLLDFTIADICPANINEGLNPLFNILGYVIMLFKIVIPILLIVFGMLDIGKSVVSGKPEEITKNFKAFGMRALAAILIFFIPSIVGIIMSAIGSSSSSETDSTSWECCKVALKLGASSKCDLK